MGNRIRFKSNSMRLIALGFSLAACDENPAEVRNDANEFDVLANYSSTVAQVGTSGVSGSLAAKQFEGFRVELNLSISTTTARTLQWRIFRGDCATSVAAANNNDPNGLLLFSTVQGYPDVVTTTGPTTMVRVVAGALDSARTYSVRFRASQSATNWNGTSPIACGNLQRAAG
jgi:hypothetical protein